MGFNSGFKGLIYTAFAALGFYSYNLGSSVHIPRRVEEGTTGCQAFLLMTVNQTDRQTLSWATATPKARSLSLSLSHCITTRIY